MFTLVKLGVNALSCFGVTKVVNDIITNNTTVVTTADKVLVNVGKLVLGAAVLDRAAVTVNDALETISRPFRKKEDEDEDLPEE